MDAFHGNEGAVHSILNLWVQVNRKDNDSVFETPHDFSQGEADVLNPRAKRFSAMACDEDQAFSFYSREPPAVKCRTEELPRPVDPDNSSTGCRHCPHEPAAGASKIQDETGSHLAQPRQGSPQLEVVGQGIAGEHGGRRQLVEATRDQPFDLAQNRSSIAALRVSQASA